MALPCAWFRNSAGLRLVYNGEWRDLPREHCVIWVWVTLLALPSFAPWCPYFFQLRSLWLTCAMRSSLRPPSALDQVCS